MRHLSADDGTSSSHFGSWMKSSIAGSRRSSVTDERLGSRSSNLCMVSANHHTQLHGNSRPSIAGIGAGAAGEERPVGANSCRSVAGGGSGVSLPVGPSLLRPGSLQHKMICAPTPPMLDDVSARIQHLVLCQARDQCVHAGAQVSRGCSISDHTQVRAVKGQG